MSHQAVAAAAAFLTSIFLGPFFAGVVDDGVVFASLLVLRVFVGSSFLGLRRGLSAVVGVVVVVGGLLGAVSLDGVLLGFWGWGFCGVSLGLEGVGGEGLEGVDSNFGGSLGVGACFGVGACLG